MTGLPHPVLLPTPREIRLRPDLGFVQVAATLREQVSRLLSNPTAMREATRIGRDVEFGQAICPGSRWTPYRIAIAPPSGAQAAPIHITAQTDELRRAALQTLLQLLRQCPVRLPALEISDYPHFPTRGVMLDVSRDKVPTTAHLKHTIDLLASLKFNHLQFYTEHTFAYAGHEEAWQDPPASPITPGELRELDAYAAARGISIAANQNCFGHLASWLKRPRYQHLAEIEGNNAWYFHQWERRGPFSLCPTEAGSETFVSDLLGQLLPCVDSPLVNIGCDETFDVGWGRSNRTLSASEGSPIPSPQSRAELYFAFVHRIARICEKHNKRPMMWADIALTHPELLHLMPRDMIGLAWWYESTDKFEQWVQILKQHGHEAWVCPGTSSWRTFTGRTAERRANIADAAEQGARAGASGFLVCDWGDMGHRQQWPISLAGLAQAAEAAWNPDRARTFDSRAAALHVLHEQAELGPWLDELGDCDLAIRQSSGVRNASALFNDLHPPVPGQLTHGEFEVNATIEQWQEAKSRLTDLIARRPSIADDQTRAELDHAQTCALFAADHAIAFRALGTPTLPVGFSELISRAEAIRVEHERLWLARNRPGGLAHSSKFYTKVIDNLRNLSSGPTAAT